MVWETVFFLIVLKIPVVYLAFVVWWAIRPAPDGSMPTNVRAVSDTPPEGPGFGVRDRQARRPEPTRPHGRSLAGRRASLARAEARR
jgi:hypothetical protein